MYALAGFVSLTVSEIETNTLTGTVGVMKCQLKGKEVWENIGKDGRVLLVISITGRASTNTGSGTNLMLLNRMVSYYRTVKYFNIVFVTLSVC